MGPLHVTYFSMRVISSIHFIKISSYIVWLCTSILYSCKSKYVWLFIDTLHVEINIQWSVVNWLRSLSYWPIQFPKACTDVRSHAILFTTALICPASFFFLTDFFFLRFGGCCFQIRLRRPNCRRPWHNYNVKCCSRWALSVGTVFVGFISDCLWESNHGCSGSLKKERCSSASSAILDMETAQKIILSKYLDFKDLK